MRFTFNETRTWLDLEFAHLDSRNPNLKFIAWTKINPRLEDSSEIYNIITFGITYILVCVQAFSSN